MQSFVVQIEEIKNLHFDIVSHYFPTKMVSQIHPGVCFTFYDFHSMRHVNLRISRTINAICAIKNTCKQMDPNQNHQKWFETLKIMAKQSHIVVSISVKFKWCYIMMFTHEKPQMRPKLPCACAKLCENYVLPHFVWVFITGNSTLIWFVPICFSILINWKNWFIAWNHKIPSDNFRKIVWSFFFTQNWKLMK